MRPFILPLVALSVCLACAACTKTAHRDTQLGPNISMERAKAVALTARPGAVRHWELEREAGGSGLRYSFDIDSGGTQYEVGVDARDGIVLENAVEKD